jgi:Xaa-Pro aminopeptidase
VTSPLRAVKDPRSWAALRAAGAAADRVAAPAIGGDRLVGRTEAQVSSSRLAALLVEEGHQSGQLRHRGERAQCGQPPPRAGRPGDRSWRDGGVRLRRRLSLDGDVGYCSDITRTVVTGPAVPPGRPSATRFCVSLSRRGGLGPSRRPAEHVDQVARGIIEDAGFGELFVHRTGHGIGIEEHEDPYLVAGNGESLRPGHAFSVEPGIYWPGRFGMRLEDIVVIGDDGPARAAQRADHDLIVVDG